MLCDNRLAVMKVLRDDFKATGADVPATENLINVPLQIGAVEVSPLEMANVPQLPDVTDAMRALAREQP